MTIDKLEVTQADRDAANRYCSSYHPTSRHAQDALEQLLASHRLQALEEAAAKVKALWREMKADGESIPTDMLFSLAKDIAPSPSHPGDEAMTNEQIARELVEQLRDNAEMLATDAYDFSAALERKADDMIETLARGNVSLIAAADHLALLAKMADECGRPEGVGNASIHRKHEQALRAIALSRSPTPSYSGEDDHG
jgi:hypothetical protein